MASDLRLQGLEAYASVFLARTGKIAAMQQAGILLLDLS